MILVCTGLAFNDAENVHPQAQVFGVETYSTLAETSLEVLFMSECHAFKETMT